MSPPQCAHPLQILIAEDNALLGEILVALFIRRGHHVVRVADGQDAWLACAEAIGRFEVVVTDHQMPRMSGLGLAERLRGSGYGGRIVVYSSSVTAEIGEKYRALGVDAIVTKSSGVDALLEAVERAER
jgi:CheY-like chemotaxis protein